MPFVASTLPDAAAPPNPDVLSRAPRQQLLPLVGLACLLLAVARATLRPLSDPDTWWHLRLGDEFWGTWSLADPGQLSPFATRPWFATQWIPELAASTFQDWFGLPGVAWLYSAGVIAVVVTAYLVCRREAGLLASVIAASFCFLGTSGSLSPRPQLVSFLLLAVVTGAWLRTTRDMRARWWLVPLTWFWACSHGMWFTGVAVGVAVIVGLALDGRLTRATAWRLSLVPALSVIAAAITPVGPKLLLAPLATSGMAPFVTEWAAPSFRTLPAAATMAMIIITVLTWGRRGAVPWSHLAVLVGAVGWTLLSARTIALGAVMMAPLLAGTMQSWLPVRPQPRTNKAERLTIVSAVAAGLVFLAAALPNTAAAPGKVPNALNDELDAIPRHTVVLNAYELGGWLTWRHPELAPVIDGMTDAYTVEHMTKYVSTVKAEEGWRDFVGATDSSYALVEQGSTLALALHQRLGWTTVGVDEGFVLLSRPST